MGANGTALSGYEVAAKLSLWLRGTTPSDALLDQVSTGQLNTADGAAAAATTMLGEPTATPVMRQFHGELLHFDRLLDISKVNVPSYNEAINPELQEMSVPLLRQDLHPGAGPQADPDVDDRLRRHEDGGALRRDGARERLRRARPRCATRRLLLAGSVPDAVRA